MHLLKCQFQHDHISGSWRGTLTEQRREIESLLEDSPSLRATVMQVADKEYQIAARLAADETGLAMSVFPTSNPYSKDQLFDIHFVP